MLIPSSNDIIAYLDTEFNPTQNVRIFTIISNHVNLVAFTETNPLLLYLIAKFNFISILVVDAASRVDKRQLDMEVKSSQEARILVQLLDAIKTNIDRVKSEISIGRSYYGELTTVIPNLNMGQFICDVTKVFPNPLL